MKLFHGSIRKKLVILVLLATMPVFLVLLVTALQNKNNSVKLAEKDTALYLNGFAEVQRRITNSTQTLLKTVASIPDISTLNEEKSRVVLETLLETNPIYTNVILVDLKGNVVAAGRNHNRTKKLNFGDRKQFKEAIASKGFASGEFVVGKSSQKAIFPFGMAVLNNQDEVAGAIIIGVNLAHYGELFKSGNYPNNSFFGLCDHNGLRLFRYPDHNSTVIGEPITKKVFDAVSANGKKGSVSATASDGKYRVIFYEPIHLRENDDAPYMYMFMGFDYEQLQEKAHSVLNRLLVTSFLSLALALFIAWSLGGRSVARLIEKISLVTKKFSQGEKNVNSNIDYSDGEIGALAQSFDSMVKTIRQREEEKHILETQLQQAYKMEAIGTLAGGIAHDFNNILTAIIGYSELALLDLPQSLPARTHIDEVLKASNRAKDLVQHILSFSRKEATTPIPVKINIIATEAMKLLRATIPTTIEIQENIDSNCGYISGNPTQVHQVIVNLCTNASQAMEEKGGVLTITVSTTELAEDFFLNRPERSGMNAGTYIKITVCDTGPGIDPHIIGRIFDPYFTTKDTGKGSGMGLSVSLGIVKNFGGTIEVESKIGHGTSFHVYFPKVDQEEMPETKELVIENLEARGSESILIVDDEKSIVTMNEQLLKRLGYKVTTTIQSTEALDLFRAQPSSFDLVITDQTMPVMTGEQLAHELLAIRPDIPIILCTGYSSTVNEDKAREIGISEFVMKPIQHDVFASTIRRVLDA